MTSTILLDPEGPHCPTCGTVADHGEIEKWERLWKCPKGHWHRLEGYKGNPLLEA